MINDVRRLRPDNIVKVKENGRWMTARVVAVMPTFIIAKNPYRQIGNTYDIARKEVHGARISDEWLCSFGWQKIKSEFGDTELTIKDLKGSGYALHSYNGVFRFYHGLTPVSREFTSLHELQNIFEDLIGKPVWIPDMLKPILASS